MKFGELPIAEAIGAILAHKLYDSTGKLVFNKGHVLGESDLAALRSLGLERIIVTQLSDADLHEDIAAERIGKALAGPMVEWRTPGVGRANLTAAARGVLHVDVPKLELINNIYDGITIATLREYSLVGAGEMVALVKVVPFGVPGARVVDVERIAEASAAILRILPLLEKQVALIVTGPEARRERLLKSFHGPVLQRIRGWGSHLLEPTFVAHDVDAIAAAIRAQASADLILFVNRSGGNGAQIAIAHEAQVEDTYSMDVTRSLSQVTCPAGQLEVLGEGTIADVQAVIDRATIGLSAELIGGSARVLDMTVEYVKSRKQFGRAVGTFQAVQHKAADMLIGIEKGRTGVYYAAAVADERPDDLARAASVAKATANQTAVSVGELGIQLHGGLGFTWEQDLHLYLKRAKAAEFTYGDTKWHLDRIAHGLGLS